MTGADYSVRMLRKKVAQIQRPFTREGRIFYNKYRFKMKLESHGIPVPKTYAFLKDNAESIPAIEIVPPKIIHDYFGEGYGHPTPEGIEALKLFKEREKIKLEPTYTAKTCAALLDFIRGIPSGACILYWHTYNSVDLSKEAAGIDYRDLPRVFHQFFEAVDSSLE